MVGAISQVVVLNDVLDAHELLFRGGDLLQQCVVVAVCLVAAAGDLVVVVAMLGYQNGNNLIRDQVFPVCASNWRAVSEHNLGGLKMLACMFEQVLDLGRVSFCDNVLAYGLIYRMMPQPLHCLCRGAHNLSDGRVGAAGASRLACPIAAVGAIRVAVAVHLAEWWGTWGRQGSSCTLYRALYSGQVAHVGRKGPEYMGRSWVRKVSVCTKMYRCVEAQLVGRRLD